MGKGRIVSAYSTRDSVRNVWVVELGMIARALVLPVALCLGAVRQIPFFWRLIDCLFGVVGIVPLTIVRQDICILERTTAAQGFLGDNNVM